MEVFPSHDARCLGVRRRRRARRREGLPRRAVERDPLVGPADPALGEGRIERGQQLCGPHRAGLGGQLGLEHGALLGSVGGCAPTTERCRMPGRMSSATFLPLRSRVTGSSVAARMVSTAASSASGDEPGTSMPHVQLVTASCREVSERSMTTTAVHVEAGREQRREPLGQAVEDRPRPLRGRGGRCRCTRPATRGRWTAPARSASWGGARSPRCWRPGSSARRRARSQQAGDVAVAGEADLAQLAEAEADPHRPLPPRRTAPAPAGSGLRPSRVTGTALPRRCPGRCPGCRRPAGWPRPRCARCE